MSKLKKFIKMFTSWSYSRYKDHKECPRKAKLKHLDKVPEGERGPALIRGDDIHKKAEAFVKGKLKRLPPELNGFAAEFKELRKAKATAEGKWAMTVQWKAVDYFDWAMAWCRVVLDSHLPKGKKRVQVNDYKTGRIYPDNEEQMELYSIAAFAHYPDADEAEVQLWYLDQPRDRNNPLTKVYTRKHLPALQKKWRERSIPILTDKKFIPRPGDHCARCPYSVRKHKGPGKPHCEF